ncbi:hypothetical protein [Deinococcus sp. NW-56]|uniref:hypothetical protein n=1 Tax=Deinococcus sp. NW-56 TaxID=2080419 RepID=UPI001319E0F3|nr:hypothetical protein [Deinococcus sp. NW-56]
MTRVTDDAHAQANADQVRLLREALAVELPPSAEGTVSEEVAPTPETPAPVVAAEVSP